MSEMTTKPAIDPERLAALRAVAEAATPGPWQWRNYDSTGPDLVAAHSGMLYVMGFARLGMNYAQPTFAEREKKNGRWTGGLMRKFSEWWKRDEKLAPDARFIAAFDPSTALALIAQAERGAEAETLLREFVDGAMEPCGGLGRCRWCGEVDGHVDGCSVVRAECLLAKG